MIEGTPSICLSSQELWCLLSQFAPGVVLGFEDPTRGLLASEVRRLSEQALQRLLARGYVRRVSDQEIALDEVVAGMAQALVRPRHTVLATLQTQSADPVLLSYHYGPGLVVELAAPEPGSCRLSALPGREDVLRRLRSLVPDGEYLARRPQRFELPEASLREARRLLAAGQADEASGKLRENGLQEDHLQALLPALQFPVYNLAVAVVADRDKPREQSVRGFAVLAGERDLWLMRPHGDQDAPVVELCATCSGALYDLIVQVLPG